MRSVRRREPSARQSPTPPWASGPTSRPEGVGTRTGHSIPTGCQFCVCACTRLICLRRLCAPLARGHERPRESGGGGRGGPSNSFPGTSILTPKFCTVHSSLFTLLAGHTGWRRRIQVDLRTMFCPLFFSLSSSSSKYGSLVTPNLPISGTEPCRLLLDVGPTGHCHPSPNPLNQRTLTFARLSSLHAQRSLLGPRKEWGTFQP